MRVRTIDRLSVATAVATLLMVLAAPALRAQECDDGDPCTVNDMCGTDGNCHGTFQAGKSCDDSNDCTTNDRCTVGIEGNVCKGDAAPVGTACAGGCGTCTQLVPIPGVPLVCSGSASSAGMSCDPGVGNCIVGQCTIIGTAALCQPQLKQCPGSSGCKGACNPQTGQCDAQLSKCEPNCERCDAATNSCAPTNIGSACGSADPCVTASSCQVLSVGEGQPSRGLCLAGTPSVSNPTPTATQVGTGPTATATSGAVGTPTAVPTPGACVGDCDGSGVVTINELVIGVNIALGSATIDQCRSFDLNNDGMIEINEIVAGVNALLNGCV